MTLKLRSKIKAEDMFIELRKIEMQFLETTDGSVVRNPTDRKKVYSKAKIVTESVNVNEIKSFRHYHKSNEEENEIDGPMCLIYFKKDGLPHEKAQKGIATMKVNESFDSLNKRLSTVRLPDSPIKK